MAKVRETESAKYTMPVSVIALCCPEMVEHFLRGFLLRLIQPLRDTEHPFVHVVCFRVLCKEVPPEPTTDEHFSFFRIVHLFQTELELLKPERMTGWENPFHHFLIGR